MRVFEWSGGKVLIRNFRKMFLEVWLLYILFFKYFFVKKDMVDLGGIIKVFRRFGLKRFL